MLLIQDAVTMEIHTQPRNDLSSSERKKAMRNYPLIHATIIISVMNVIVRNQILALDVDQRIILSKSFQNQTPQIRKFTGTRKILKLMRTDQRI